MSSCRPKVTIVGALPPPIGGVTVFLRRLTDLLQSDFEITLLDLRNIDGKVPLFDRHIISPFQGRLMSILWLQWKLISQRHGLLHFHFSDVKGLILVAMLFSRCQSVMLTLHHGVSNLSTSLALMLRFYAPLICRKIGTIHALNSDQRVFYQSQMGFKDAAVFQCPTHIAPSHEDLPVSTEIQELLSEFRPYILTSGVGNRLNRADLVMRYWGTRPLDGFNLVVSIYGDSDPNYASELQCHADTLPTATLVGSMPESDFNALLKNACVYLRPAEVDSFGIAVADALAFGTPVLASDACDRAEDVNVFDRYDMDDMAVKLEELLLKTKNSTKTVSSVDRLEDYRDAYKKLTCIDC